MGSHRPQGSADADGVQASSVCMVRSNVAPIDWL